MGVILVYKPTNIAGGPHPVPSGNLLQFAIEAMAIEIVDLSIKNCDLPIKHGDFPIRNIKNGHWNMIFPWKNMLIFQFAKCQRLPRRFWGFWHQRCEDISYCLVVTGTMESMFGLLYIYSAYI